MGGATKEKLDPYVLAITIFAIASVAVAGTAVCHLPGGSRFCPCHAGEKLFLHRRLASVGSVRRPGLNARLSK